MRWVFLSLQSPAGSGQDGGRSPRSPRGAPGHTWAARGRPRPRSPARQLRSSPKGPAGWSEAGWNSPSDGSLAAASLSSPSPPPPQPIPLRRLPSPPCPALQANGRPSVHPQGPGGGSPSDRRLERPCPPARLAEAPCAPRPTTRGGDQAHVHHVSCSFQRGQILTSVPRVEARLGLAPWAPVAPTFTQRCASACSLPPSSQACCRLPFPP